MLKTETAGVSVIRKDASLVCSILGDIDHHSARAIRLKIDEEIALMRPDKLILDVSNVTFMDSSGLGLILGRYNKAAEVGAMCILVNPNENVTKILDIAGIGRLIRIERSSKHHE